MLPLAVTVALTNAEELRLLCGRLDRADEEQRRWVQWQAELLAHRAQVVAEQVPEFPALAGGLGEFARAVQDLVRIGEGDGSRGGWW